MQLCVRVVSRFDTKRDHSIEGFLSQLWLVLLGAHLHVEAEIAFGVLPFVEKRLEASVEGFEYFVRRHDWLTREVLSVSRWTL